MNKPVKTLFFIETLGGGGAEKVLIDLVNHMDREKFEVTVQTVWPCPESRKLDPGIRYRSVYRERSGWTQLRYRLEAALGLTYRLHIRDGYDLEAAYLECGATKIMAGSTNRRAKKVAWVHCDLKKKIADLDAFVRKASKWYSEFDAIACVSKNVRESFIEIFGCPEKTAVVYNTVDDDTIREKSEIMLPEMPEKRRLTAVTLGRLTPEKAYDRLLRVHQKLIDLDVRHDLWILGEGEQRPKLEAFIRENGLEDSVKLLGFRDNPYPYMKAADLLVCSSRFEGFSTFVTEGLILGKPIVTTECSGMRELLGDSEYGLIVDNTEEALLKGVQTLLEDAPLRKRYASAALARGEAFYAEQLTRRTEDFLLSLLKDKKT